MIKRSKKKDDIFQRRKVRDVSFADGTEQPVRSLKGVNPLHIGASVLMMVTGFFAIFVSMTEQVFTFWISSVLSLLGSMSAMVGLWVFYETVRDRKSMDNLVKKAIIRVIRNQN